MDSVSRSGTATAFRCGLHQQVPYDETLASQMPQLNSRLGKLERYFEFIGPLKSRVHFTLVRNDSETFRIGSRELSIGEAFLPAQGQLEKAFLRLWFRQKAHPDLLQSRLIEESLTDLLYFGLNGEFDLQDSKTQLELFQEVEPRWPRVLSRFGGYCRSLWKSNEDMRICQDLKTFKADDLHKLSLRPLISHSLMAAYSALSTPEQLQFLRSFATHLDSLPFQNSDFGLTPLRLSQQSYFQSVSQLEKWIFYFDQMESVVPHSAKFAKLFELELKKRGFERSHQDILLDTLVFGEELTGLQKQKVLIELAVQKDQLMAIESKGMLQFSDQREALNSKWLGNVKASRGIYLHCGSPDLKKISEFSQRVEKLMYIQVCKEQIIALKPYFEKGSIQFAKQNPGIRFAEFHLPSLMMALEKMPGQNPILFLEQKKKENLRPIGWRDPQYDESAKAYRAESAIEIVNWYRL